MSIISDFVTPIIGFLLTIASGIWLSRVGRPLNVFIFTVHKLIALAAVIFTTMQIYNIFKSGEVQSIITALIVIAGLCVLALFVSGAIMSIGLKAYDLLLNIHKASVFLMAASMVLMIYFLSGMKL